MIDYASIFCGAGLLDIPFSRPDFRCVLASDSDAEACDWYRRNHGTDPIVCDIRELRPDITAGLVLCTPPCQQFSLANPRAKGFRDAGTGRLFRHAARACREMSAELVLLENVEGLVRRGWADDVLDIFAEQGFRGEWRVLDASAYGVPQSRRRVVFAFGDGGFRWPPETRPTRRLPVATTRTPPVSARRMQQVPEWFELPSGGAASRLVGNGVPLGLATAIRNSCLEALSAFRS